MSAYANARSVRPFRPTAPSISDQSAAASESTERHDPAALLQSGGSVIDPLASVGALDALLNDVVARVADAVVARLTAPSNSGDEWLDTRAAAEYLGIHRDTLRKLAAERAVPSEQDGRGCKLFFQRAPLDAWRHRGGRTSHLSSVLGRAA